MSVFFYILRKTYSNNRYYKYNQYYKYWLLITDRYLFIAVLLLLRIGTIHIHSFFSPEKAVDMNNDDDLTLKLVIWILIIAKYLGELQVHLLIIHIHSFFSPTARNRAHSCYAMSQSYADRVLIRPAILIRSSTHRPGRPSYVLAQHSYCLIPTKSPTSLQALHNYKAKS